MNVQLGDLSWTPWRRVLLSERRNVWCLVDAVDYDWIIANGWRFNIGWHRDTPWKHYAKRNVGEARSTLYLHREVLIRADPQPLSFVLAHHADHINGQSLDNRRANLRWLTPEENRRHRTARADIPALDQIVRLLIESALAGADKVLARDRALADVPFD